MPLQCVCRILLLGRLRQYLTALMGMPLLFADTTYTVTKFWGAELADLSCVLSHNRVVASQVVVLCLHVAQVDELRL